MEKKNTEKEEIREKEFKLNTHDIEEFAYRKRIVTDENYSRFTALTIIKPSEVHLIERYGRLGRIVFTDGQMIDFEERK